MLVKIIDPARSRMTVTVQIPDQLAIQLPDESDEARSRRFLEAYVRQRLAEGEMTTVELGEASGRPFH